MTEYTKKLMVVIVVNDIDLGGGVFGHLLVARDGDAYMVMRSRTALWPPAWEGGEVALL